MAGVARETGTESTEISVANPCLCCEATCSSFPGTLKALTCCKFRLYCTPCGDCNTT